MENVGWKVPVVSDVTCSYFEGLVGFGIDRRTQSFSRSASGLPAVTAAATATTAALSGFVLFLLLLVVFVVGLALAIALSCRLRS